MKNREKRFSLDSIFGNSRFLTIISIIIAFFIWLWIAIDKSPEVQTVIKNVPVIINLSDSNLQIFDESDFTVDVTVTGKKYALANLTAADIRVEANTTNVKSAGIHTLQLKISPSTLFDDFTITSISSTYINVFFDTYSEKEIDLKINIESDIDSIVSNEYFVDAPLLSKTTISVAGPSSEIEQIKEARANIRIDECLSSTTTFNTTVELVPQEDYSAGFEYTDIVDDVSKITVTVPVLKIVKLNTVVKFENLPQNLSEEQLQYSINPKTVSVAVPIDQVDLAENFVIATIDFNSIGKSNNIIYVDAETISPELNSGMILVDKDKIDQFTIRIDISNLDTKINLLSLLR